MMPHQLRIRNVRRYWPQSPTQFERPKLVSLGRATSRSSSYVVRNGIAFQNRVTQHFSRLDGWFILPELEVRYLDNGKEHSAYIDAVAINPISGWVVVLECKRTHTPESFKQIWRYMAYLASRLGGHMWRFAGLEVCSLSGRSLEYPGETLWMSGGNIRLDLVEWFGDSAPKVGIVPWYVQCDWRFEDGKA